jgi:hypothetical protein
VSFSLSLNNISSSAGVHGTFFQVLVRFWRPRNFLSGTLPCTVYILIARVLRMGGFGSVRIFVVRVAVFRYKRASRDQVYGMCQHRAGSRPALVRIVA